MRQLDLTRPSRLVESLEQRRLLFNVDGTNGSDSISLNVVNGDIIFVVNGVSDSRSDLIFDEVVINALGGNDTITIVNNGGNLVTVNGGAGADTLNNGIGNDQAFIGNDVTFNGGTESDTLAIFDGARVQQRSYFLSATGLGFGSADEFLFSGVDAVNVNGSTIATSNLTVTGDPGADVNFDSGGSTLINDFLIIKGSASDAPAITPATSSTGTSTVAYGANVISALGIDGVTVTDVNATYVAPTVSSALSVTQPGVLTNIVAVQSNPSAVEITVTACAGFTFDFATLDTASSSDQASFTGDWVGSSVVGFNAGVGSNGFTFTGDARVNTSFGALLGQNANVSANGGNVTLVGSQTLNALDISNGSVVDLSGALASINTNLLRVISGTGTLNLSNGQSCVAAQRFFVNTNCTLIKSGGGSLNLTTDLLQPHNAGSLLRVDLGAVTFANDAGTAATANLSVTQNGGAITFASTQHLANLTVQGSGLALMQANGSRVLSVGQLTINPANAKLDLTDNALAVRYSGASPFATIDALVKTGFGTGTWNGKGITSSTAGNTPGTALGAGEASDLFATTTGSFAGEAVDQTTVVVRFASEGDATLDRFVNFDDLLKLAANYNSTSKRWTQGDFTFDSAVNFDDLLKLASKYNTGLAAEPAPISTGGAGDGQDDAGDADDADDAPSALLV